MSTSTSKCGITYGMPEVSGYDDEARGPYAPYGWLSLQYFVCVIVSTKRA